MTSLADRFLRPSSVAVVGASDDPARIGGRPLHYLEKAGFSGRVFAVNPHRDTVQGHHAYPSVRELPEVPDLVVVALPRDLVLGEVTACAELGVPGVIVLSSGFAEEDADGAAAQAELVSVARAHDTRILGPNANGVFNPTTGLYALFSPVVGRGFPASGDVAVVTQSAAVGTSLLDLMRRDGFGISSWVHVGNEADIGLVDVAADLVVDGRTRTLLLAFESLRQPAQLLDLLQRAHENNVGVVAFQSGFSAKARAAAASHTGALTATNPHLVRDVLIQHGATVTTTFREAVRSLAPRLPLSAAGSPSSPPRVAVMTSSGGFGVITADALDEAGASVPVLSNELQARLKELAPYCHPANPVDTTAQIINDRGAYRRLGEAIATSGEIDILVTFLPHPGPDDPLTEELLTLASARRRECALAAIGPLEGETARSLREHGVAVGYEPMDLMTLLPLPASAPERQPLQVDNRIADFDALRAVGSLNGLVSELDAKAALAKLGVSVVPDIEAAGPEEAGAAWSEALGPVAVKLHAPGLAHKESVGGVRLGVAGVEAVTQAAEAVLAAAPPGSPATVLLEPMVGGIEAFVGVSRSDDFGAVAVIGVGGTDVESTGRIAYAVTPVRRSDVGRMMSASGLTGVLGSRLAEDVLDQLHGVVHALTRLVTARGSCVRSVDVNPVMVTRDAQCVAVDALMELTPSDSAQREAV
jgi:acyl-CoA synthetase (NDP forming)